MISSIIHVLFCLKFSLILVKKKRNNKESMICLTLKPNQNISEMIGVSLWPPSNQDLNPFDYTIWGVLENKTNATSNLNKGSLKTAIEEEWNKMSEGMQIVSKACWYNSWKNDGHIE